MRRTGRAGAVALALAVVAASALPLAGAAGSTAGGHPGGAGAGVPEGSWALVRLATPAGVRTPAPGARYTLTVSGSDVFGAAACNRYAGRLADAGPRAFGPLAMTRAACADDGLGAAFVRAASAATTLQVDADRLRLLGPEGDVTMRPVAAPHGARPRAKPGGGQPSARAARNRAP